jgi:hypothetical protein
VLWPPGRSVVLWPRAGVVVLWPPGRSVVLWPRAGVVVLWPPGRSVVLRDGRTGPVLASRKAALSGALEC